MKKRTIEEIHDPEVGHKKFAWFVDEATDRGYKITNIREYNEKFKFEMDGHPLEFDKMPDLSVRWQLEQCENILKLKRKIEEMKY